MYNISDLNDMSEQQLASIAESMGMKKVNTTDKDSLVYDILDKQAEAHAATVTEQQQQRRGRKPRAEKGASSKSDAGTPLTEDTSEGATPSEAPAPRKRGRKPKNQTEQSQANENPGSDAGAEALTQQEPQSAAAPAAAPRKRGRKSNAQKAAEAAEAAREAAREASAAGNADAISEAPATTASEEAPGQTLLPMALPVEQAEQPDAEEPQQELHPRVFTPATRGTRTRRTMEQTAARRSGASSRQRPVRGGNSSPATSVTATSNPSSASHRASPSSSVRRVPW